MAFNENFKINVDEGKTEWIEAKVKLETIKVDGKKHTLDTFKEIGFKILNPELYAFTIIMCFLFFLIKILFTKTNSFGEIKDILAMTTPIVTTYLGYSIGKVKKG